jgi:hypothetical protein
MCTLDRGEIDSRVPGNAVLTSIQYCMKVVEEERKKDTKEKSPWIQRMTESKDDFLGRPLTDREISEEIIGNLYVSLISKGPRG